MHLTSGLPRRLDTIRSYKERGGFIAAVLPIHYPRALLRGFDILPVEVWGPPGIGLGRGAAHLQPNICSIAHNALSFLQSGGLDVTDILIVPHTCDSLQGLGSILIDFISPRQPVIPLYLPRGRRENDLDFFAVELQAIYQRLGKITSRAPSESDLLECVLREELADQLLGELHRNNRKLPLSNLDLYRLLRCREYLPAEDFTRLAQETLALAGGEVRQGIPIVLSGIVPEPMDVLEALSEMGAVVVGDDLACCGRRVYPPGESQDPFRRMGERILKGPPDPTRGDAIQERLERLLLLAGREGAKGIIFYTIKFCEPELFDLPILREELERANIPSITVEVDINDRLSSRVITRLEAFLEMIR